MKWNLAKGVAKRHICARDFTPAERSPHLWCTSEKIPLMRALAHTTKCPQVRTSGFSDGQLFFDLAY
ncbi:hypothetical protein K7X08_030662 [Anisodus acutangulus]|uniref:Uncharacterized protein n=1 Tax=Anisodus acutangulus TaxID=402998 RepID=A0A9Q1L717_9SOLA|nr:hypothetical protein K7X08_030662 [Anisodus acutangulus]